MFNLPTQTSTGSAEKQERGQPEVSHSGTRSSPVEPEVFPQANQEQYCPVSAVLEVLCKRLPRGKKQSLLYLVEEGFLRPGSSCESQEGASLKRGN